MNHLTSHISKRSNHTTERRSIDAAHFHNDEALLADIGYKQELRRHYSTLQVFGIAFSIMGLLPSITSTMNLGLEAGPAGLVWGWFCAGPFILLIGLSMTFLGSAIPTSGGLYYWTSYYAPDSIRVPLSFVVAIANTMGLCGGLCSISYGLATEILSAVVISSDGNFEITTARSYGIFVASIVSNVIVCCLTTKNTATLQSISIYFNCFLVALFYIAVPVGVYYQDSFTFNSAQFVFTNFENSRLWPSGWSFMLSWMPCIWTIGAFDSVIHCSEEAKDAQKTIPFGIIGSIVVCWVLGFFIVIIAAFSIKDGDVAAVISSDTGSAVAQIIYDALGKQWCVAFMSLIAVGQYLMACSILVAASRQTWAFARDDGLPVVYNFVKYVNPKVAVPIRATIFVGTLCIIIGLLVLIGSAGSNALFSLGVMSNSISWATPVLMVLLPTGRSRFVPGPFYWGKKTVTAINVGACTWVVYLLVLSAFPDSSGPDPSSMNYTCVINPGVWILSLSYYYIYGYKVFSGPKSNLDEGTIDGLVVENETIHGKEKV